MADTKGGLLAHELACSALSRDTWDLEASRRNEVSLLLTVTSFVARLQQGARNTRPWEQAEEEKKKCTALQRGQNSRCCTLTRKTEYCISLLKFSTVPDDAFASTFHFDWSWMAMAGGVRYRLSAKPSM